MSASPLGKACGAAAAVLLALLVSPVPGLRGETPAPDPEKPLENLRRQIPEFTVVDDRLVRGGQPSEEGFKQLRSYGVKTVINFRDERDLGEWERGVVESLGLRYVNFPWRIERQPPAALMQEFLDLVREGGHAPFFMHCKRGVERTGVADALYRHYHQGVPKKEAYRQAMEGHNRLFYWRPFTWYRYRKFIKELGTQPAAGLGQDAP